ncbi:MAG TPA: Holliday junction branch migration protein RuvA [Longimicrobiales bacterium]|nr:Holliday junction branch migration protein RuvA [Longimicrobiales bacterium]
MISRLRGTLVRRDLGVVEVATAGGVTYQVEIPLTVYERLPREGADLELRTYQVVREDALELYGFLEPGERALFGRLLSASGVGPKLALNMLSTLSPAKLIAAITSKDIATLRQIPGLGSKKAERLTVELADRLDDLAVATTAPRAEGRTAEEAVGALVALGYTASEATIAVRRALDEHGKLLGIDLIKAALASARAD